MTAPLTVADFTEFYQQLHGHPPFPWQQALTDRVLEGGQWPDVVDVPTGLGKTSLIDAAVFAAAARPDAGRRRVFFVVDRRLVVDEAFEHAGRLKRALDAATGGICVRVAAALRQPDDDAHNSNGQPVLDVVRMRSGLTWSWRWLDRPDRHAVVTGTIDQIGSRLLFRGYGVGENLRPIDAALGGSDSLIIIDEAHLAGPFIQTLRDATGTKPDVTGKPPVVITMSTTVPPRRGAMVHRIGPGDEGDDEAGRRLRAGRRLHLVTAPAGGKSAATAVARELAGWARSLAGGADSGRVVAVVCNTVARARAVFGHLAEADAETVLLTGRIRSADRDYLLRRGWYERVRAGRGRGPGRPLILVATQTIEVGADIDADALVTESPPLDALTQRLGRVNRLGQLDAAPAIVIHDPACGADDPVYGAARLATWHWLTTLAAPEQPQRGAADPTALGPGLDVSPAALRHLTGGLGAGEAAAMRAAPPYVPVLFAATLDAWTRTSPVPHPDPPVAPYLHGLDRGAPDVTVVWRADLTRSLDRWEQLLSAVPPAPEEMLEVPATAVRRWLYGQPDQAAAVGDVEGVPDQDEGTAPGNGEPPGLRVVRYRGPRDSTLIRPGEIAPGDTIIVPAALGGCDEFGWNPASSRDVIDVADLADRHGHPLLRLAAPLNAAVASFHPKLADAIERLVTQSRDDIGEDDDGPRAGTYRESLTAILGAIPKGDNEPPLIRNMRRLADSCTAVPYPPLADDSALVETGGSCLGVLLATRGGGQAGDTGALGSSASGTGGQVGLGAHQRAVARRAGQFARNLGLDERVAASVSMAALLHDEGKRDPRFQAMLHGRPIRQMRAGSPLLAKSGMGLADRVAYRRVRRQSGYPPGMRHEALSARIARLIVNTDAVDADPDLVVHLVAAHHGRARPLLPPVTDPDPREVPITANGLTRVLWTGETVDWDAPSRFAALNDRYGRWGLALLETIVRLADMWCSERDEHDEEVSP